MPAIPRSEPFREAACPLGVCDGSGWILGPEDVARECECRAQRLKRGRNKGVASVIPPRYRGVSLDRPPVSDMAREAGTREALATVRKYVDNLDDNLAGGRGLWLTGGTGTGKTTLAMLVSKAALGRSHSVAIYSLPKLLARIRRTYDSEPGGDSYLSFFERLTSVDLLHLDDLGVEKRSDWVLEQLYAIVNERYEAQRSILVTTNLNEPELEEQIGERTVSRLLEMCGEPRALFGQDQRSRYDAAREDLPSPVRHVT
jgi:DNA replication protein DnaC